jgi:hypothetical protein
LIKINNDMEGYGRSGCGILRGACWD